MPVTSDWRSMSATDRSISSAGSASCSIPHSRSVSCTVARAPMRLPQPTPQCERHRVQQQHECEPERAGIEQRIPMADHPPEADPPTRCLVRRPHRRGPHQQRRHQPGQAEPQHPLLDVRPRPVAGEGPFGQEAGEEEEHPDREQPGRTQDRDEHQLCRGCERDLVDLVVGPAADSRVAEQRVPADDPGDQEGPEVVEVGPPDDATALLDGRHRASLDLGSGPVSGSGRSRVRLPAGSAVPRRRPRPAPQRRRPG
jgi:hypothetical protein